MDFSISEDQQAVQQLAEQILGREVTPEYLKEIEGQGNRFDLRLWQQLAESGLLGVAIDEAHGGMGFNFETLCLLIEAAGKTLPPVPLVPVLGAALALQQFGSVEQRDRWLPGIAAGSLLVTTALSEPGSDDPCRPTAGLQAQGEGWRLSGCKHMVVAAEQADAMLLSAYSGDELVLLAVETGARGVGLVAQEVTTGE